MLNQEMENRSQIEFFCVEEFVPQDHLLRKIGKAVYFSHIYDLVEELYCPNNGRPSCDPVVLFKMVIIQHLYGIPSLRRTVDEISMNIAYRWFLGYTMAEKIPHFATISYNFKHRFTEQTIEDVFHWVLDEIAAHHMLSPEAVFIDGTHIKASANMKNASRRSYLSLLKSTRSSSLRRSTRIAKIMERSRFRTITMICRKPKP